MANTLTGNESLRLPEFDAPPADPLGLLDRWLGIAAEHDVREPLAVALATVDAQGLPASRIVLVKEVADGALLFSTHVGSRKGQHLAATPFASMTFYWRETLQQITVAGPVDKLSDEQRRRCSPSAPSPPKPPQRSHTKVNPWMMSTRCTSRRANSSTQASP